MTAAPSDEADALHWPKELVFTRFVKCAFAAGPSYVETTWSVEYAAAAQYQISLTVGRGNHPLCWRVVLRQLLKLAKCSCAVLYYIRTARHNRNVRDLL